MSSGIHALETTYHFLFVGILMILGIMLFLCLLRACMGPTVADRLVSINMMGTMVMVIIATLAVMMEESYLVDICIIYAMISFLAVIVLSKVIMGVKKEEESEVEYEKAVSDKKTAVESLDADEIEGAVGESLDADEIDGAVAEIFDEDMINEAFEKEPDGEERKNG